MIALWMLYATLIGGLLTAAAHAFEHLVAQRGWARRWVWLAAIAALPLVPLLTSGAPPVPASSPARTTVAASEATASPVVATASGEPAPVAAALPPAVRALASGAAWLGRSAITVAAMPAAAFRQVQSHETRLARFDDVLTRGWAALSVVLLGLYMAATFKLSAQRRRWPAAQIDGESVLIAPNAGPAVVGTFHPAIVLPAWTLGIEPPLRRLILRHEREHLRARDPILLHLVTVAAYLLPWNVAIWWMLRRLRIAVELDCDRRVLRAGGDARQYADLLLAVGTRRSAGRVLVPALVERQSLLAQRILAMCPSRARFQRVRSTCAAGAAYTLLATAFALPMPAPTKTRVMFADTSPAGDTRANLPRVTPNDSSNGITIKAAIGAVSDTSAPTPTPRHSSVRRKPPEPAWLAGDELSVILSNRLQSASRPMLTFRINFDSSNRISVETPAVTHLTQMSGVALDAGTDSIADMAGYSSMHVTQSRATLYIDYIGSSDTMSEPLALSGVIVATGNTLFTTVSDTVARRP